MDAWDAFVAFVELNPPYGFGTVAGGEFIERRSGRERIFQ